MLADRAAERSREQDAEQNAAEDGADHAPAFAWRREMRGERHEEMHRRAHHPNDEAGQRQPHGVARERDEYEPDGSDDEQQRDQRAALAAVAQWNEQEHAERRPDLREHRDEAHVGYAEAEGARDIGEQRLNVINIGDDHARASSHEPHGRARYGSRVGSGRRAVSHRQSSVNDI